MKTSKYYRLDEKVGGMRGGVGKKVKTKTKWWQTTPKPQSTNTSKKWWRTKSRRLKKEAASVTVKSTGANAVVTQKSLTRNQNRILQKVLKGEGTGTGKTYVEPKNANQKAKRIKQMVNIISSTKGSKNNSLKNIVDSKTGKFKSDKETYDALRKILQTTDSERKQTYKENFEKKEKTQTMQTSLNDAEAKYRDNMKIAENKKAEMEQRTADINLIKSAQTMSIKTKEDIDELTDKNLKTQLTNLFNIKAPEGSIFDTSSSKSINPKITLSTLSTRLGNYKEALRLNSKKAIGEAKKSHDAFKKERKKMNNYKSKYGTLNVLRNHSKKSHTLKKIGNIAKAPFTAPVYVYNKTKKGIQTLINKKKSKKTHLKKIEQLQETNKAEAIKRAVEQYGTPKHMIKMNTKIKRAEDLFGQNSNALKININQTYSVFKTTIPKDTYTKDERKILKDYYKAKKIKGMINSNTNSITKHLKTSQEEKIDKLPLTNDKISTITNNNFKQFTPLLDIPNFNSLSPKQQILFKNENTFDSKKANVTSKVEAEKEAKAKQEAEAEAKAKETKKQEAEKEYNNLVNKLRNNINFNKNDLTNLKKLRNNYNFPKNIINNLIKQKEEMLYRATSSNKTDYSDLFNY